MTLKKAVVLGGSGGIGSSIVEELLNNNYEVINFDIENTPETENKSTNYRYIYTNFLEKKEFIEKISNSKLYPNGIDLIINAQGIIHRKSIAELTLEEWENTLSINLTSIFISTKCLIDYINSNAKIINISSGWGIDGGDKATSYCASKGGVNTLTKAMCIELREKNITVNAICPGDIDTKMLSKEEMDLGLNKGQLRLEGFDRPSNRIGTPSDVAKFVCFLASIDQGYINGSILVIDGGGLAG